MRRSLTTLSAAALALLLVPAAHAGDEGERKQVRRVVVLDGGAAPHVALAGKVGDPSQIEGDHLKIEDLASLLPGEARTYQTEEGRDVMVTRGEGDRYTLQVAGKTIELGGELEDLAAAHGDASHGARKIVIHRQHAGGDEAGEEGTVEEEDVLAIATHGLGEAGDGPAPVVIEIVGEREEGKLERRVIVLRVPEEG
jgi:hypothetical protein